MARYLSIHVDDPQARMLAQAAETLRAGGVIAFLDSLGQLYFFFNGN